MSQAPSILEIISQTAGPQESSSLNRSEENPSNCSVCTRKSKIFTPSQRKFIVCHDCISGSGEKTDICSICLDNISKKIGSPDICNHFFCLNCIFEWAKTKRTCPLDRKKFLTIQLYEKSGGKKYERRGESILENRGEVTPKANERNYTEVVGVVDNSIRLQDSLDEIRLTDDDLNMMMRSLVNAFDRFNMEEIIVAPLDTGDSPPSSPVNDPDSSNIGDSVNSPEVTEHTDVNTEEDLSYTVQDFYLDINDFIGPLSDTEDV